MFIARDLRTGTVLAEARTPMRAKRLAAPLMEADPLCVEVEITCDTTPGVIRETMTRQEMVGWLHVYE